MLLQLGASIDLYGEIAINTTTATTTEAVTMLAATTAANTIAGSIR